MGSAKADVERKQEKGNERIFHELSLEVIFKKPQMLKRLPPLLEPLHLSNLFVYDHLALIIGN